MWLCRDDKVCPRDLHDCLSCCSCIVVRSHIIVNRIFSCIGKYRACFCSAAVRVILCRKFRKAIVNLRCFICKTWLQCHPDTMGLSVINPGVTCSRQADSLCCLFYGIVCCLCGHLIICILFIIGNGNSILINSCCISLLYCCDCTDSKIFSVFLCINSSFCDLEVSCHIRYFCPKGTFCFLCRNFQRCLFDLERNGNRSGIVGRSLRFLFFCSPCGYDNPAFSGMNIILINKAVVLCFKQIDIMSINHIHVSSHHGWILRCSIIGHI